MATNSRIEWTNSTWNPVAGCTVVSPGCANCYAMRLARRLEAMGQSKYEGLTRLTRGGAMWNGRIRLDEQSLAVPASWSAGRMIFVNSMSDLFHKSVPLEYIQRVFGTMRETPQHTYQILTKRAERLEQLQDTIDWPTNVWRGVSVESSDYQFRIDHLRRTGAKVKFLSLEPLLGPLDGLDLHGIDWVIAGGESGPGSRPVDPDWVRSIRDQCVSSEVTFHFKQWGGPNKKKTGRLLDGRTWDQFPSTAATTSR